MNKIVSATAARKNFFQLLKLAAKPGHTVTVTLEGNVPIVFMSQEEFEGWMETLEIMSDPKLVKDINLAMKEKGGIPWEKARKTLGV